MKIKFEDRLSAINWIANFAKDEGTFEVLREQLNFNFIYAKVYFLQAPKKTFEVVWLEEKR